MHRKSDPKPFDPTSFILDGEFARPDIACELSEESREALGKHQRKMERLFVKVPFLEGMRIAKALHMPAMAVWLELLRISFSRHGQNPVTLSNVHLRLNPRSKREALNRLLARDFIRVTNRNGKAPLVTILCLPLSSPKWKA